MQDTATLRDEAEALAKRITADLKRNWIRNAIDNTEKLRSLLYKISETQ